MAGRMEPQLFDVMRHLLVAEDHDKDFSDKWDLLRIIVSLHMKGCKPDFPPHVLKTLMSFAKDQGNHMYNRKLFPFAHELYLLGTIIADILREKNTPDIDLVFVSKLYSNLAITKNKLDRFSEAVDAARTAIAMNNDNIKAYFRLLQALKFLHRYDKALQVAREGERKASEKGLTADVKQFADQARELEVHLPPQPQPQPVSVSTPLSQSQFRSNLQQSQHRSNIQPSQVRPSVVVSAAMNSNNEDVDNSWLSGTNIHTQKKQQELRAQVTSKAKGKKKKGKQKSQEQSPKPPPRPRVPSSTTEEEEEEEDEEEESDSSEDDKSEKSKEDEEQEFQYIYRLPPNSTTNRFSTVREIQEEQTVRNQTAFSMGLDDFEYSEKPKAPVSTKPQPPPLPPSLEAKYETVLACSSCYVKDSEGMLGSRYRQNIAHSCGRDILLARSKQDASALWLKIRLRPQRMSTQAVFSGKFRLCQQYQARLPCKIGETNCTFAHSETEIDFWNLDRNGMLNIAEYVAQLRKTPRSSVKVPSSVSATVAAAVHGQPPSVIQQQPILNNLQRNPPIPQPAQPRPQLYPTPASQIKPLLPDVVMNNSHPVLLPTPNGNQVNRPPFPPGYVPRPPHQGFAPQPHIQHRPLQGGISYIDVGKVSMAYQPYQPYQPTPQPQIQQNFITPPSKTVQQPRDNKTPDADMDDENLQFPLEMTHDYALVCSQCLFQTYEVGAYMINLQLEHKCDENILVVKQKGQKTWIFIRERLNHRNFPGRYILCRYFTADPPERCTTALELCSFAHSLEEQYLWGLEKDEKFSIRAFILANSKKVKTDSARVDELFRKYNGQFRFLCSLCFQGPPCRIVFKNPNHDRCASNFHIWSQVKLLVHVNLQGKITPIDNRPFVHKSAFFRMCSNMQFCMQRVRSRCHFAHSNVERDVWYMEKDAEMSREDIVQASEQYHAKVVQEKLQAAQPSVVSSAPGTTAAAPPAAQNLGPAVLHCPYNVIEVCDVCWKKGLKKTQKGDRCNGPGNGHLWTLNKICMLVPRNKQIRPLPNKIPNNCNFIICKHIQARRTCEYSSGYCQFAHSQEEVEVWTWMVKNNVRTLEDLIHVCNKSQGHPVETTTKKIQQGQSVITTTKTAPAPQPVSTGVDLQSNAQYCRYCSVMCETRGMWDEHCASEQHMFNVNSDREHQWNYRQPPWGIIGSAYQLCELHQRGLCQYSNQPDMYNVCQNAHSQEELDEWLERWRWRQMKREAAKQEGVYSYMESLLEEYEAADSGVQVISEQLAGVDVSCDRKMSTYHQDKMADMTWTFTIRSKGLVLEKVALLYNQDRLHFSLEGNGLHPHTQIAQGNAFLSTDNKLYMVRVRFSGGMFGSFMQCIVFDFGKKPVIGKKLSIELGTHSDQEQVKRLRRELAFDRWTGDNRKIVRFDSRQLQVKNDLDDQLQRHYKAPMSTDAVITQQSLVVELNQHNYVHKMHKLLYMEELARQHIISSYNLEVVVELTEQIDEGTMIFVMPGELFARVPLNGQLSEDTNAGKLILTSVARVLVAPQGQSTDKVYEAVIVEKENFDYDGRGKDYIYICLSPSCCRDLQLRRGDSLAMEVQFQMSRQPFCRMHKALDLLRDTKIVFPDLSLLKPGQRQTLSISSHVLNDDQVAVIRHIVAETDGYTPPLIIYGSFGTGKSETLAQATMLLLKQRSNARILICTHSNSAADLYITKHLDAFASSNPNLKLLRIYQEARRLNTVPPVIQKYCLVSSDRSRFELPKPSHILNHHVVITTLSMALYLASCQELAGHFQHIFIDEAAQAFECETIMPLALATEGTCVVLAGDHMQMSPKVYSSGALRQNLQRSLLERLFRNYSIMYRNYRLPYFNILLRKNYRTRMEILRFIAATFYGGPDQLECRSNHIDASVPALRFFAAHGCEVQDSDKTSYYNMAEIEETVDRVADLYANWPPEWGRSDASKIAVVTPYYDQVQRVRVSLRRRRKELGQVTVERVMNVQGKEFLGLFITTVRTRHLLENPPACILEGSECDGEFGDLGFLSDEKLLNTAMTRAQSMVAVIGDPVALCIIGKSMNIWRTYLKHCQKMGTIYPTSITLETVQAQVRSIMNSPLGANLQKMAEISKQERSSKISPQRPVQRNGIREQSPVVSSHVPKVSRVVSSQQKAPKNQWVQNANGGSSYDEEEDVPVNPFDVNSNMGFFDDWTMDYGIEPDEILKQLAKESMTPTQQSAWASPPQRQNSQPQSPIDLSTPLKIEDVQIKRQGGHAVVHYKPNWASEARQRKLISANDFERQFDSDSDISDSEEGDNGGDRTVYPDYTQQQLKGFLQSEPERYKQCTLKVENSRNMYALDTDPHTHQKKLRISSRLRCGRGFDNDQVVVEVLQSEEDDINALPDSEQDEVQGRVVGILRRAISPKYHVFLCTVEEGNTGLMVPLNRGIPKIFNLETPHCHNKAKKGHVCVYTFAKNKEITFHHWEPIDQTDPGNKLFIVRYLKWDVQFYSPLGIVVGVLPAGTTVEEGMKILNLEHHIPKKFREEAVKECDNIYHPNYRLPDSVLHNRVDHRNKLTFTIDAPETQDLDDALSIEPLPEDCYNVGIHIADVSYFVKSGSYIDNEAQTRGVTYYAVGQEPVPMIPNRLSTDLCSLKPREDRLAMSIFLTVNHEGEVRKAFPRRSVICSKHRLTYDEVETILTEGNEDFDEDLQESLMMLQRISEIWRKKRLGNAALYQQMDPEAASSPAAHMLVEELMIMANHQVAKMLLDKYPQATPLRQQLPPNELELAMWRSLHQKQALQSVALTRAFLPKGKTCSCDMECQCIEPVVFEPGKDFVSVSLSTWDKIKEAVEEGDLDLMQNLIVNPELHPQLAMSLLQLQRLQERGFYVCSGETSIDDQWHYSLNLPAYTHFTSPIRRYPDLIVHRLVSAMIDNVPAPYTQHDLKELLSYCNDVALKARRYERATQALQINVVMKAKPLVLYPVVESVDEDSIRLYYPSVRHITPAQGSVALSRLNLSQAAQPLDDETQMVLSWQQRIYDVKKQHLNPTNRISKPLLDSNRFIMRVPAYLWHQLMTAILQEDQDRMLDIYDDVAQAVDRIPKDPRCITDLSSEVAGHATMEHFVKFEAQVGACSVLRVQMASSRLRGLVAPKIQLLSLTPTLDVCLEHRCDPIRTFAEISTIQAAKQNYGSPELYRDSWLAALRMEASVKALSSDESAVVHNVPIVWRRKGNGQVYAIATLPLTFCTLRQIKLSTNVEPDIVEEDGDSTDRPFDRYYDYLCIRYSGVTMETPDNIANKLLSEEILSQEEVTWVGHCLVTSTTRDRKNDRLTVHMELHQSAICVPEELLKQPESNPRRATIEWIAKTLPDRRMEKALCDLPLSRTTDLARDIALGRNPADLDTGLLTQLSDLTSEQVPRLAPANIGQDQAVRYALTHSFSLIQGPPGTGKTVTGVRLAYLFSAINRRVPGPPSRNGAKAQVLYCGPSNKSVDVVASYLKKLGPSCPKLIRVYSELIEQRDFPLPHNPVPPRARGASSAPSQIELELRDIALHHVIRQPERPQAKRILEWDKYFKEQDPKEVTFADVQNYQNMVASAQIEVLKTADVILCTCTASSSPKLLLGTHIKQLIIDECGMCTEPESLVPMVALRPQQVVLIGDHKQLRPIVTNNAARGLGLERSMFERYADKAQMLTTQYRMHESIQEFPSSQFYSGRLECGREEQKKPSVLKFWPGGRQKPIAFVHVVGREESLSVSTSEGSEQSKSNSLEVLHAVRTATMLNRRFHVKAKDIVILSQYRAQCAEISKQLHLKGQDETDTSTVIASQGSEWDYVILSTVRSMPQSRIEKNPTRGWILRNLGFITDQNQINVALTRARKGLIIIGNKHLLKVDHMWRKLLTHFERQQKVVDAHEFMK